MGMMGHERTESMHVLIAGAGLVGSYYAYRLSQAGESVTILARGERAEYIKRHGITLENYYSKSDFSTRVRVATPEDLADARYNVDLVIVCMQMVHLPKAMESLKRLPSKHGYLFLGNNTEGLATSAEALDSEYVYGGFGGVGGTLRGQTAVYVDSQAAGKSSFDSVVLGTPIGSDSEGLEVFADLFRRAHIKPYFADDIDAFLLTHAAMVVPLAAALYQVDADVYELASDKHLLNDTVNAVKEALERLRRRGFALEPRSYRWMRFFPTGLIRMQFRRTLASPFGEIGLAAHAKVARKEMEALARGLIERTKTSGVRAPRLERLIEGLRE
jgi:2-dehydropantoate 2-reductase